MDKKDKLLQRFKDSPHNATFADLKELLISEGFTLDRTASSHHVFKKADVTFVIPMHGKRVKSVYVRRAIALIEDLKERDQ